eukprot:8087746-Alexandrium_andersonii.AAC.1
MALSTQRECRQDTYGQATTSTTHVVMPEALSSNSGRSKCREHALNLKQLCRREEKQFNEAQRL